MTDTPLLKLHALRYTWPGSTDPIVLPNLTINQGEKVFLYGPSGSGKSTLLALVGGLVKPDRGEVWFGGTRLDQMSGRQRDRFRADHLGIIFQQFNLLPWLDVRSNVALPCRFSKLRAQRAGDIHKAVDALLMGMDLESVLWSKRADALSVGQQQRVAAARALIGQPDLILADEPTSALDLDRRTQFIDLLFKQVHLSGSTLLFVSHEQDLASRFDRQLSLGEVGV